MEAVIESIALVPSTVRADKELMQFQTIPITLSFITLSTFYFHCLQLDGGKVNWIQSYNPYYVDILM